MPNLGASGGGASASGKYSNAQPMDADFRGYKTGQTFSNTPISDIIGKLLYDYINPAFSSFSFPNASPYEVGDTFVPGNLIFTWGISEAANFQANTITLRDDTNATNYLLGILIFLKR